MKAFLTGLIEHQQEREATTMKAYHREGGAPTCCNCGCRHCAEARGIVSEIPMAEYEDALFVIEQLTSLLPKIRSILVRQALTEHASKKEKPQP